MLEKGLLIYLLINVLACILYGIDKWKAVHHRWRIPESTLMLSAVFIIRHTNRNFISAFRLYLCWNYSVLSVYLYGNNRYLPRLL